MGDPPAGEAKAEALSGVKEEESNADKVRLSKKNKGAEYGCRCEASPFVCR
jgi:hypothetical protein